jgi:2-polyprenyl-6-methoxyphenol hydroxylase-like FAD-dependent oxidoreductase
MTVTDIYDSPPLKHWHRGGIVLVGDAAHPSLPNMGQGTSQAFEDAAVLADCLDGERTIDAALTAYQARRRRRSRAAWCQARRLARIGGWRSRPACWLREQMVSGVPQYAQRGQLRRLFLTGI